MLDIVPSPGSAIALTTLVDRAAAALTNARGSAEVLEAAEMASLAYDAAKRAGRLARAKHASDTLIAASKRAQADALLIESNAQRRIADEYDAAQERGEVVGPHDGAAKRIPDENSIATAAEAGVTSKQIYVARQIRDAEAADPGIVERTLQEALDAGEEPTRAKVRKAVKAKSKRKRHPKPSFTNPADSQHDRDLRSLLGVWESTCETARLAFLQIVNP